VLASSSLVVVPAGPAGGALGSGVAQLALLHFFGSGVAVGSVAQSPALHKPSVVGGLVARIKESDRSAVLVKFSSAFVGRTQPMMLHSAGARGSPMAQAEFWHAIVCVPARTSARAAKNARRCMHATRTTAADICSLRTGMGQRLNSVLKFDGMPSR